MSAKYNINIEDGGFIYKDSKYLYSEVLHIYSSEILISQRVNVFLKVGAANAYSVLIKLSSQREIKIIIDESTIFIGFTNDKSKEIDALKSAISQIQESSFDQRLSNYETQIKGKGYFSYDDCRFFPRDKIVFRNKEFLISESTLLNYGFAIELRPKNYGWKEWLIRNNSPFKSPQFNIQTDTDVIFYLMEKYFGLRW
jgi:hypothetical protein